MGQIAALCKNDTAVVDNATKAEGKEQAPLMTNKQWVALAFAVAGFVAGILGTLAYFQVFNVGTIGSIVMMAAGYATGIIALSYLLCSCRKQPDAKVSAKPAAAVAAAPSKPEPITVNVSNAGLTEAYELDPEASVGGLKAAIASRQNKGVESIVLTRNDLPLTDARKKVKDLNLHGAALTLRDVPQPDLDVTLYLGNLPRGGSNDDALADRTVKIFSKSKVSTIQEKVEEVTGLKPHEQQLLDDQKEPLDLTKTFAAQGYPAKRNAILVCRKRS